MPMKPVRVLLPYAIHAGNVAPVGAVLLLDERLIAAAVASGHVSVMPERRATDRAATPASVAAPDPADA